MARQLASGLLPGGHTSRRPGLAREFSQYRSYQPGDDLRHVDWKLYARSDRYFLRESEVETALSIRIVIDATASMRHTDIAGPAAGVRKFDAARVIAAALASLVQSQGDAVELHAISAGKVLSSGGRRQRQPFEQIVHTLDALEPSGQWPRDARLLQKACGRSGVAPASRGGGSLVVVLTDLHEHEAEIRDALGSLRVGGDELLLLHLIGRDEAEFPFAGLVRFEDWETGAVVETDAESARRAWLAHRQQQVEEWKRAWPGALFEYVAVRLDEPLDRVLRGCLLRRMRR